MADLWNWFDTLPGDVQEEWNMMRNVVRAVADGQVKSWSQQWNPQTGDVLPRMVAVEIEESVYQQACGLIRGTKE